MEAQSREWQQMARDRRNIKEVELQLKEPNLPRINWVADGQRRDTATRNSEKRRRTNRLPRIKSSRSKEEADPAGKGREERAATNAETQMEMATMTISEGRGREEDTEGRAKRASAPKIQPIRSVREAGRRNPNTTIRSKPRKGWVSEPRTNLKMPRDVTSACGLTTIHQKEESTDNNRNEGSTNA